MLIALLHEANACSVDVMLSRYMTISYCNCCYCCYCYTMLLSRALSVAELGSHTAIRAIAGGSNSVSCVNTTSNVYTVIDIQCGCMQLTLTKLQQQNSDNFSSTIVIEASISNSSCVCRSSNIHTYSSSTIV
jgi:hypothetical protein